MEHNHNIYIYIYNYQQEEALLRAVSETQKELY